MVNNQLGRKLTLRILLFSSVVTLLLTVMQIGMEYRELLRQIDRLPTTVENTLSPAIADAIWSFDTLQVKTLLKGVNNLEFVERSELILRNGRHYQEQRGDSEWTQVFELPIMLRQGKPLKLASLRFWASKEQALQTVLQRAFITLLRNAFKTVLVVGFMLLIFRKLVTRHLSHMISFLQRYKEQQSEPLTLQRHPSERPDELDLVADAFNSMQARIQSEHQARLQEAERLEQTERQLAHLERVGTMGELATSLAHELNQPLAGILGYSDMAHRMSGDQADNNPALQKCLDKIGSEAERASAIIKRTRTFLQTRQQEKQSLDLVELCQQSIELVQHRALQHQVDIVPPQQDKPALFCGDSVQMQQVLVNLLLNAIDAFQQMDTPPADACITVSLECTEQQWLVRISDNGPGISDDMLPRLFDPFVSSKVHGMGIGLSICRNMIEAMQGAINAENHVAGGACFTIRLPVFDENARLDNNASAQYQNQESLK